MAYFSLFESRKGYLSLSTMADSFTWHRSIAWHTWSLRTLSIFPQVPLVFKVSICKITCYSDRYTFALNLLFFSYSFQYSFFLHISRDRTMICHQNFNFCSYLFGVLCASHIHVAIFFLRLRKFLFMILLKIKSMPLSWYSPCSGPIIWRFGVFIICFSAYSFSVLHFFIFFTWVEESFYFIF